MANHQTICPACGANLVVHVYAHLGGSAEENIGISKDFTDEERAAAAVAVAQKAAAAAQSVVDSAKANLASLQVKAKVVPDAVV